MQAGDAKVLLPHLKNMGIRIVVHGKGFLPYLATFLGIETPDIKVRWYEKLRRELHALALLYLELRNSPNYIGGFNAG